MVLDQSFLCPSLQPKDWGTEHRESGHSKWLRPSAPRGGLESTRRTHLKSWALGLPGASHLLDGPVTMGRGLQAWEGCPQVTQCEGGGSHEGSSACDM